MENKKRYRLPTDRLIRKTCRSVCTMFMLAVVRRVTVAQKSVSLFVQNLSINAMVIGNHFFFKCKKLSCIHDVPSLSVHFFLCYPFSRISNVTILFFSADGMLCYCFATQYDCFVRTANTNGCKMWMKKNGWMRVYENKKWMFKGTKGNAVIAASPTYAT